MEEVSAAYRRKQIIRLKFIRILRRRLRLFRAGRGARRGRGFGGHGRGGTDVCEAVAVDFKLHEFNRGEAAEAGPAVPVAIELVVVLAQCERKVLVALDAGLVDVDVDDLGRETSFVGTSQKPRLFDLTWHLYTERTVRACANGAIL